jgi:hypothetical protein
MSQFRARCTAYGFIEGTPEHAYCTQRARGRFEDSLGHIGKPLPSPQYQYQQTQPLPKPTTWCDSTRVGKTVYTTCQ